MHDLQAMYCSYGDIYLVKHECFFKEYEDRIESLDVRLGQDLQYYA